MLTCAKCHKKIDEKDALKRKNEQGAQEIICQECFKAATGVDFATFAYRREVAKQTFFAVIFCLAATIYAFVEKGSLYGAAGLLLTALIWYFSAKIR